MKSVCLIFNFISKMKRVSLVFALIGIITLNGAFAQIEKFDNLLPIVFVEGNSTIGDFYIGKFEVTQSAWIAVMGNNPSRNKSGDNYPVERISWNDVQEFLSRLNALTGRNYRLPTLNEWQYAAGGGKKSQRFMYSGSNNIDDVAWFKGNSRGSTKQVGTKRANELGIYDMSGNVTEFIYLDLFSKNNLNTGFSIGGAYNTNAKSGRIIYFKATSSAFKSAAKSHFGFRIAHEISDVISIPEVLPENEYIQPIVANASFIEITENNMAMDDIPINKGNGFLNAGTSNFGIITGDGTTTFNIYANGGYFVANKFALVGGLGFEMLTFSGNTANILAFNAGFRYYLVKTNNGGLFINSLLNVAKPNDLKTELGLTLGAGYSFFLNNRVSFEPIANFMMPFKEGSSNIFVFGGGFSIFF